MRPRERADEVALALSIGSAAIDEGLPAVALEYLRWAKHHAAGVPAVREALGIAAYLDGDFATAQRELATYRRLTGKNDQDHVFADCQRALGKPVDRVAELIEGMLASDAPRDRKVEGLIVWASAIADDGRADAARALLRRHAPSVAVPARGTPTESDLKLWYVEADLAQRTGDRAAALDGFARVVAADPSFHDARERFDELRG